MAAFTVVSLWLLVSVSSFSLPTADARMRTPARPPVPAWPQQFVADFVVRVYIYGPNWNSTGVTFYDWTTKTFRSDYIGWCLPLFDSGSATHNNYTCSFLATGGNMYFVNHTAKAWEENECCLFQAGLEAVPPDWMKSTQYNGSAYVRGMECDVWWFPGTSDPENPCYGYWDDRDSSPHTPVRFFGLASVGRTILDYTTFSIGPPPKTVSLKIPNPGCFKECQPPRGLNLPMLKREGVVNLPHFPTCG